MRVSRKSIGGMSATSARGPHRDDAGRRRAASVSIAADTAMRMGGAHHAHVQLAGERNIRGKAAVAGDKRPVFQPWNRAADEAHRAQASRCRVSLMRWTQIVPPADIDLVEAAGRLRDAPIGRQRLIEQFEQQRAVHAVVADHDDRLVGMARKDQPQRIGGSRDQILQRFAVGEANELRRRQTRHRTTSGLRCWLARRS